MHILGANCISEHFALVLILGIVLAFVSFHGLRLLDGIKTGASYYICYPKAVRRPSERDPLAIWQLN
jgi:hypothetical protein